MSSISNYQRSLISYDILDTIPQTIVLFALIAVCLAADAPPSHRPPTGEAAAQVLSSASTADTESYNYGYSTSNGIKAQATGILKEISKNESAVVSQGQFEFKTPEGNDVSITYVADENGYQPQGAILPTPPPIPDAIIRALEFIAEHWHGDSEDGEH